MPTMGELDCAKGWHQNEGDDVCVHCGLNLNSGSRLEDSDATDAEILAEYRALHDGLSEMVEAGRLNVAEIPDDYDWLINQLVKLAVMDPGRPSPPKHMLDTPQPECLEG
jgi:hypothetical protein